MQVTDPQIDYFDHYDRRFSETVRLRIDCRQAFRPVSLSSVSRSLDTAFNVPLNGGNGLFLVNRATNCRFTRTPGRNHTSDVRTARGVSTAQPFSIVIDQQSVIEYRVTA